MKFLHAYFYDSKNILLVAVIFIAINLAFYFGIITPLYKKIVVLGNDIANAQQKIAQLDYQRKSYLEIEQMIRQEGAMLRRVENTLLDINAPLIFIELIEELGREQNIFAKIQVREQAKNGIQKFQIIAEGEFPNLFQYLKILEFFPYQITFLNMQIASSGQLNFLTDELAAPERKNKTLSSPQKIAKMFLEIAVRIKN